MKTHTKKIKTESTTSAAEVLLDFISTLRKCVKGQTDLVLHCEGHLLKKTTHIYYIKEKKEAVNEKPDHLKYK